MNLSQYFHQGQYFWFGGFFKGFLPFIRAQFLLKKLLHREINMPAVKGLEAGETTVFSAAVGEIDLMAQSGTPDLESIIRWVDFLLHSLHLPHLRGDVKVLPVWWVKAEV